ncbi:HAMP domain-containing sensor histidine kinase [Flavihumibacter cheonanensis]|uniref:sensor histidine kinase n=1 Tax=Flavihumibacter cheonanensis TaxID=1442385 RepID=UPI001EF805C1|nr:HAMP domain-containing sensor histidine kinase [Flavihumibacter cheonanensis]MCG7752278.1 HAMP domain-containing histidine kinase [Flavihumibacter cheonanensis]
MVSILTNWRSWLALLALSIVIGTIFYSRYLAKKIAQEERDKVELWVNASKAIFDNPDMPLTLPNMIRNEQTNIPIIETNEKDSIVNYINLDSTEAALDPSYLSDKLREFKRNNEPFILVLSQEPYIANKYYYGNTRLLKEVKYYPIIQLVIVGLLITLLLLLLTTQHRSSQNQLWAGMAKETAHQLGTPLSSLQGWVEMLKESGGQEAITRELEKDVNRLKLVSDRFSKIGSIPNLEPTDIVVQVDAMLDYIKRRASGKIRFEFMAPPTGSLIIPLSATLFDWVIENLLKNALDAMEGQGQITVHIQDNEREVLIDVTDTGKGIPASHISRVFDPGFTTKKRGWGLGLSLSKRIIEQFHRGELSVKQSEPGKGTTFRILLPKLTGLSK